ncbi:Uncharacterised protein [Bordetella pertussis]|nr:Uncharacterised protein [Bordetella pertussis]
MIWRLQRYNVALSRLNRPSPCCCSGYCLPRLPAA